MAIVLKEACRYQNFLNSLIGNAELHLRETNNVMLVEEKHYRNKVQPTAENVTMNNLQKRTIDVKPDVVIKVLTDLLNEKTILTKAISTAKARHCPDMDETQSVNRIRHGVIETMKRLVSLKPRTSTKRDSDYCFNAEGNQVQYYYDVEVSSKPDFDKENARKILYKMSAEMDNVSNQIDQWMSSTPVDYTPNFNLNETFEDIAERYSEDMAS